jgi:hypothetical protein
MMPCVNTRHKPKIGTIWPTFSEPGGRKIVFFLTFLPISQNIFKLEYWNLVQETSSGNQIWWYNNFFRFTQFDGIRQFHEFKISHLFDFVHEKSSSRWSWFQPPVGAHFFSFLLKTIFHHFFQYTFLVFHIIHIILWFNPFWFIFSKIQNYQIIPNLNRLISLLLYIS